MLDSSFWTLEVDLGGSRSSSCDKSVSMPLHEWLRRFQPCFLRFLGHPTDSNSTMQTTTEAICTTSQATRFRRSITVQLAYELAYLPSLLRMAQCNSSQIFGVPSQKMLRAQAKLDTKLKMVKVPRPSRCVLSGR